MLQSIVVLHIIVALHDIIVSIHIRSVVAVLYTLCHSKPVHLATRQQREGRCISLATCHNSLVYCASTASSDLYVLLVSSFSVAF